MMLASLALIYLSGKRRIGLPLTIIVTVLFALVLALSNSRSVLLFIMGTLLLAAAGYWVRRCNVFRHYLFLTVVLIFSFIAWEILLPVIDHRVETTTTFEKVRAMGGIDLRISEWHKGLVIFASSPVFGIGIGNYGWHSFLLQSTPQFSEITKNELFAHSHNLFVQVLAELGLVGFSLLVILIIKWFSQYIRWWLEPPYWFVGACLLTLLIHSNVEYPLWYSFFLGIAAIFFGVTDQSSMNLTFSRRLGQAATGVVLVIIGALLAITLAGYIELASIKKTIITTGPASAAHMVEGIRSNQLLRPWAESTAATHGIIQKEKITQQLAITTRVMQFNPDPIKVRRQIQYLALADRFNEARSLLHLAALSYATYIPAYICHWITFPDKELVAIVDEADKLWSRPLECQNGDPINHPSLRLFM